MDFQPHIVLVGMPAAGKSAAGALLAQRRGMAHVDLDEAIARQAGVPVGELLRREGEAAFRLREAEAVERVLAGPAAVISTGGGTACFHDGMARLRAAGHVVWLDAGHETLAERALTDPQPRPLLGETRQEVRANLQVLSANRGPTYAHAHCRVDANLPLDQVVKAIDAALQQPVTAAAAGLAGGQVVVHAGDLSCAAEAIAAVCQGARAALVVDRAVADQAQPLLAMLQARKLAPAWLPVAGGEKAKNARGLAQLWEQLAQAGIGRGDVVVAIGGGAVTDLAGFAAATWQRGVRSVLLPTTLLAMADASVGGKTAIDLPQGKNLVGAFHQPQLVWCAAATLQTLPARQFRSGLAEIAKIFATFDADAWHALLRDADKLRRRDVSALLPHLTQAIAWKAKVVAADPQESADAAPPLQRAKLNLGHTFGHAAETASQYSLLHGEAVAIGLCGEAAWAAEHGGLDRRDRDAVADGLAALGLPVDFARHAVPQVLAAAKSDKKLRATRLRLPVLRGLGDAYLADVDLGVWQAQMAAIGGGRTAPAAMWRNS